MVLRQQKARRVGVATSDMNTNTLDSDALRPLRPLTDPKEIVRINDLKILANDNIKVVKRGRYGIFGLAALYVVTGLVQHYFGSQSNSLDILLGTVIMAALYLLAAGLSYKPRWTGAGLIIALAIYLLDHLSNIFIDPAALVQGIMWKVAITTYFAYAILAWSRLKKELSTLADYPVGQEEIRQAWKLAEMKRTPRVSTATI